MSCSPWFVVLFEGLKAGFKFGDQLLVASGVGLVDRGQQFIQVCLCHVMFPLVAVCCTVQRAVWQHAVRCNTQGLLGLGVCVPYLAVH